MKRGWRRVRERFEDALLWHGKNKRKGTVGQGTQAPLEGGKGRESLLKNHQEERSPAHTLILAPRDPQRPPTPRTIR